LVRAPARHKNSSIAHCGNLGAPRKPPLDLAKVGVEGSNPFARSRT
jgi:hypothetical protein